MPTLSTSISLLKQKTSALCGALFFFVLAAPVHATQLATTSNTGINLIVSWWQAWIDFFDGPAAVIVSLISIFTVGVMFAWNPKGALGVAVRVATAIIVIMNAASWLATF